MSRKPFKVNMSFNEALKKTAEYKPKDKDKANSLEDDNKIENKETADKTIKPPQ